MATHIETATFGGGCFWCTEAIFRRVIGVESVQSGFSGGQAQNPTWKDVYAGQTGHAECVQIRFNPTERSYADLLTVFFATHDPTTLNRQGNDVGTKYRSAIFFHDDNQKSIADSMITELNAGGKFADPIVTEVSAYTAFYPAGSDHDNFYESGGRPDYCHYVIEPKVRKFMLNHANVVKHEYKE